MPEIAVSDVKHAESIQRWLSSRQDLWGPAANNDTLIEVLANFCTFAGKAPDEIIDDCLKPGRTGEALVLRTRARRQYVELIARFETATGSRDKANVARSFLIHNGIAMNPGILP